MRTNAHPVPRETATLYFSRLLKNSRCTNLNWPHPPVKNQSQISPHSDSLGYDLWLEAPPTTPQAHNSTGGGERDRTDDLMLAKHALSQLSYTPADPSTVGLPRLVGLDGFEPSTPALSRRCSNQLSYRPGLIEPGSRPEAPGRQNSSP